MKIFTWDPGKTGWSLLGAGFFLFSALPAQALEGAQPGFPGYVVAKERFRTNGVLVSRPKPLDVTLSDFLAVRGIRSLESYARWVAGHVDYKSDLEGDDWAGPLKTLNRQYGDCEDYAFLNQAVLKVLGFKETQVLGVYGPAVSHAICVFKEGGVYVVMDNEKVLRTGARTFKELSRALFRHYRMVQLNELNFKEKNWKIIYQRII